MPRTNKDKTKKAKLGANKKAASEVPPLQKISLSNTLSQEDNSTLENEDNGVEFSSILDGTTTTLSSLSNETSPQGSMATQQGIPLGDISSKASDGILPTISTPSITSTVGSWWSTKKRAEDAVVPLPKNYFELQAFKQSHKSVESHFDSRYKKFNRQDAHKSIYSPLFQPLDYTKVDENNNFLYKNILLPDLIDPQGFRKLVPDSFPRDSFEVFFKLAKVLEVKKDLTAPTSQLETSLLWGSIIRIVEAFLVLSNLVQVCFNQEALQKIKQNAEQREFQNTIRIGLSSIAQDLYTLVPILDCKVTDRDTTKFQKKVLELLNHRMLHAPTLLADKFSNIVGNQSNNIFKPTPLKFSKLKKAARFRYNKGIKRRRNSRGRSNANRRRNRRRNNHNNNSRRGSRGQANANISDNRVRNLNVRNTANVSNTVISKDKDKS